MAIKVFHASRNPETGRPYDPRFDGEWPLDDLHYTQVAEVDSDDFDEAFMLTNHIDHPWFENDKVTAVAADARSTSVGDVFVTEDGASYRVEAVGFKRVDPEDHEGHTGEPAPAPTEAELEEMAEAEHYADLAEIHDPYASDWK